MTGVFPAYFSLSRHRVETTEITRRSFYEEILRHLSLSGPVCGGLLPAQAAGPEVNAKAVLLMEKTTGQVLYEEHAHDPLELASVTKVMTMLLIMEALEEGTITKETMVPVSATAAGMGGSQVYMKGGGIVLRP
ncbi:MAG: hypothetical protein ACLT9P_10940 [Evtepia gabavorous]